MDLFSLYYVNSPDSPPRSTGFGVLLCPLRTQTKKGGGKRRENTHLAEESSEFMEAPYKSTLRLSWR